MLRLTSRLLVPCRYSRLPFEPKAQFQSCARRCETVFGFRAGPGHWVYVIISTEVHAIPAKDSERSILVLQDQKKLLVWGVRYDVQNSIHHTNRKPVTVRREIRLSDIDQIATKIVRRACSFRSCTGSCDEKYVHTRTDLYYGNVTFLLRTSCPSSRFHVCSFQTHACIHAVEQWAPGECTWLVHKPDLMNIAGLLSITRVPMLTRKCSTDHGGWAIWAPRELKTTKGY